MTRRNALDEIIKMVENPKNRSRYLEAEHEQGLGVLWHLERAKESLKVIEEAKIKPIEVYESDFAVSIKAIKKLMDEQGWIKE